MLKLHVWQKICTYFSTTKNKQANQHDQVMERDLKPIDAGLETIARVHGKDGDDR